MKVILKIPRSLYVRAIEDLSRPHSFALERVGFFSTKRTLTNAVLLVHCVDYHAVADDHYVRDDSVGVRIGSEAIRIAMGRSLSGSVGQIHVHSHGGVGLPTPSSTDRKELPGVVRSLQNANADAIHGWMVFSRDDAWASLSSRGILIADTPPTSIVGFPTRSNQRNTSALTSRKKKWFSGFLRSREETNRYQRQSFLGKKSEAIIAQTVIGIVGLGGGGSHVAQQLAHLGFRRFVLCDHDRISGTNLNRLVGATQSDVRQKLLKTDIIRRNIKRLHRGANIVKRSCKWEDAINDLLHCDLIVGCVDSFSGRRDLEAFCRRNLIPLIDVGMDIHEHDGKFEINGQVILSMPGEVCMHCTGFLNEKVLALEAQNYGAASGNPQVVWSNGLLCSAAVGIIVDLVTDWSAQCRHPIYQNFIGSQLSLIPDKRLSSFPPGHVCRHYPLKEAGDPTFHLL